ncbi:class I SAM-dependent methyltransferase [Providencia stuartii]|uniref:class I SAM-dependent methyltransferase n=1 Tax=Providencia stuartii TaxID=588 RepID=UPI003D7F3077
MKISFFYQINHYPLYMKNFIASPTKMGTVLPSSRWLCNTMLNNIDWRNSYKIAEIGAGNGVITQYILQRMSSLAYLELYEINNDFIKILQKIDDHRTTIHHCSAEYLSGDYDIVISGIPFRSLRKKMGMKILKKVQERLIKNNGSLILFQYTQGCEPMFSRYFSFTKKRVYLNFPPAWVYTCKPKLDSDD